LIANLTFINPQELFNEINNYCYYTVGPMTKIVLGFNKDRKYYKMISGNNFIFDYEIFINLFEYELNNKESELLIDINSFINELNCNTSKKSIQHHKV
jgi:hypothetical protein